MYLVHSKGKARSQKVTRILKSQIGHATHVSWSTLANEFDYCVHRVVFSAVHSESQVIFFLNITLILSSTVNKYRAMSVVLLLFHV